jgi:hypothetical protein
MGLTKVLSKRLKTIEDRVLDSKYAFVVVVRSEEELERHRERIGPKTQVIIIKAAERVKDAIKQYEEENQIH